MPEDGKFKKQREITNLDGSFSREEKTPQQQWE